MSYIVKHWRGDLPLRTAFWINGILLSIPINLAGKWLAEYLRYAGYMRYWSPLYGLYIGYGVAAILIVVFIWQVVVIWRSATNYEFEEKKRWWGKATKLFVGLVVAASILVFVAGLWRLFVVY